MVGNYSTMSDSVSSDWIGAVAIRTQRLLFIEHQQTVHVMPFVEALSPEQRPVFLAAVRITEGRGSARRSHRVDLRTPHAAGNDIESEARWVVSQFIAEREQT